PGRCFIYRTSKPQRQAIVSFEPLLRVKAEKFIVLILRGRMRPTSTPPSALSHSSDDFVCPPPELSEVRSRERVGPSVWRPIPSPNQDDDTPAAAPVVVPRQAFFP